MIKLSIITDVNKIDKACITFKNVNKSKIDKFNKVSCTTKVKAVIKKFLIYSGKTPSSEFSNPIDANGIPNLIISISMPFHDKLAN